MRSILCVAVLLALPPAHAHASCGCTYRGTGPRFPSTATTDFPTNGLFIWEPGSGPGWRDAAGTPLALVPVPGLSAALQLEVMQPVGGPLTPGAVFYPRWSLCPPTGTCGDQRFTVGPGPDLTPPSPVVLLSAVVFYAQDAPPTAPEGAACDDDVLHLELDGRDDLTPRDDLVVLAYVADTADGVRIDGAPDVGFGSDHARDGSFRVSIGLGSAVGHQRDGSPLRQAGPFCFAVALMDWAGNIGGRSEPRCLDTTDPSDPAVQLVAYAPPCTGCCSVAPGQPGRNRALGALLGAMALLLLWFRRR